MFEKQLEQQISITKQLEKKKIFDELINNKKSKELKTDSQHLKIYLAKTSIPDIWIIKMKDWNTNSELKEENIDDIIHFKVKQTGVINKIKLVLEKTFEILNKVNKDYDKKYFEMLQETETKPEKVYDYIGWMIEVADTYAKKYSGLDFDSFLKKEKITKNSIVFTSKDNENIYKLSVILKLYMPLSSTTHYKYVSHEVHKNFFKFLTTKMDARDLVIKIHNLINKKIFRNISLDSSLLSIIQMKYTKSTEDFALTMFDFIISSILTIYDLTRNPATFLATSISSMVGWEFQDLKNLNVIYKQNEDIFEISNSSKNLEHRIIINKLIKDITKYVELETKHHKISLEKVYQIISDKEYNIQNKFYDLFIVPLWKYVFNIKYDIYFLDISDKVILQLMFYFSLKSYLENVLKKNTITDINFINEHFHYLEIFKLVPIKKPITKKTIYNLQNPIKLYENSKFSFYGFKNILILMQFVTKVFNILKSSKFISLVTSESITSLNNHKLKYLEEKLLPFFYVILDPNNDKKMNNMKSYKFFLRELIRLS